MKQKVHEIREALNHELYNCALALSLALPDNCAKVEFRNSDMKIGEKYAAWFDSFAKSYFTSIATVLPDNTLKECCWLTGEKCWKLRCAVLHEGSFYWNEKNGRHMILMHAHKRNSKNYSHIVSDGVFADVDVIAFCNNICDAVEAYYEHSNDKDLFLCGDVVVYSD